MAADPMWYYKDKDGEVHGPFESKEMLQWLVGGYFGMDLLVKRDGEPDFKPLYELTRLNRQIPFANASYASLYPAGLIVNRGDMPAMSVPSALLDVSGGQQQRALVTPVMVSGNSEPITPCATPVPAVSFVPAGFHPIHPVQMVSSGSSTPSIPCGGQVPIHHPHPVVRVENGRRLPPSNGTSLTFGQGPSPIPPELDGNSSHGTPSPQGYPYRPGSEGCESEGATSSTEGPSRHHSVAYPSYPPSFTGGYTPYPSGPHSVPCFVPVNTTDPIQLEFMQRHLQEYQQFIEIEMTRLQQAKERIPIKIDASTETNAAAVSNSSTQVGGSGTRDSEVQTGPLTLTLTQVRSLFANLGINVVPDASGDGSPAQMQPPPGGAALSSSGGGTPGVSPKLPSGGAPPGTLPPGPGVVTKVKK